MNFEAEDFLRTTTRKQLIQIAREKAIPIDKVISKIDYESELRKLQSELVNLQKWIAKNKLRVVVIFEGRDASGKGGAIKRFKEHLNPRSSRSVSLTKPTKVEKGQWYFRRYISAPPNPGELVFFDRSWYNRAVVEPVNNFCTRAEYDRFMEQVNDFERMLIDANTYLIKLYFSISKATQAKRFEEIKSNPLKRWKMTPVEEQAQSLWDEYTRYKTKMFAKTNTDISPWHIINADKKSAARLNVIAHIIQVLPYTQ
jgi:polyphosphate kinase 2